MSLVALGVRSHKVSLSLLISTSPQSEIVLAAGTYREQVVLERPVTLVAAGDPGSVRIVTERGPALVVRTTATLRGIVLESADPTGPAVSVESGAPVFEHCEVRGARAEASGTATPSFRHCTFTATAHAGVYVRERGTARIERCTFAGVRGHAIVGAGAARLEIRETRVDAAQGAGLRLLDEARADVLGGTFSDCQGPGVVVADACAVRLVGCRVAGGAAEGVRIDGSSPLREDGAADPDIPTPGQILDSLSAGPRVEVHGVVIEDCDIVDVALEGVVVGAAGQVRVDRSRLTGVRRAGMLAGGSARLEIRGTAVAGAAAAGILARGTARVRAADVDITGCGPYGVSAIEHAEVELADSRVTDCALVSAHLTGHATLRAVRSTLRDSRGHGVHVRGHAIAELNSGCRVESCTRDGVRVEGAADAVLRDTEISDCRIGVVLATRHHPVLRGCRVHDVRQAGIVVGPGGMPVIGECEVARTGDGGILLDQGSAAHIEDCRVRDVRGGGIVVSAGATPSVRRTTVTGSGDSGLYFHDGAAGVFEDCEVSAPAVHMGVGATPDLRGLREIGADVVDERAMAESM